MPVAVRFNRYLVQRYLFELEEKFQIVLEYPGDYKEKVVYIEVQDILLFPLGADAADNVNILGPDDKALKAPEYVIAGGF